MKTIFLIITVYFLFGSQQSNSQFNTNETLSTKIDSNQVKTEINKACVINDTCFKHLISDDLTEIKNSLIELNKELKNY